MSGEEDDDAENSMDRNKKQVSAPIPELINKQQLDQLNEVLWKCSEEDRNKLETFIQTSLNGDWYKLPVETYKKIYARAIENRDKYRLELESQAKYQSMSDGEE